MTVAYAVLGGGMRNKLQVDIEDPFEVLNVFMAKRKQVSGLEQPFKKRFAYPAGSFKIQQDFDNQYIIVSLEFARELLGAFDEVSALGVGLSEGTDKDAVIGQIKNILGPDFHVKDRYGQEASFLKVMNIEKWMSFAILSLTLVLVAFNMIGSLWMIVLEKRRDISILKSMGATSRTIRNVFLNEGLLLCGLGLMIGIGLAYRFVRCPKSVRHRAHSRWFCGQFLPYQYAVFRPVGSHCNSCDHWFYRLFPCCPARHESTCAHAGVNGLNG